MEVDRAPLADAGHARGGVGGDVAIAVGYKLDVFQIAVDLVRRGEDDRWRRGQRAERLEQVERAAGIDGEVVHRVVQARGDRHLRREMVHLTDVGDGLLHGGRVAHVGNHPFDAIAKRVAQPSEVGLDPRP